MKIAVYNLSGKKIEDMELSDDVFGLPSNNALLHQAYVAVMSNRRQVIAHTKDMAEVKGSGRKLWRQKGTGSARVGSVRSPLWRKGGIIFGPTKDRNFKKKINKKMLQGAIKTALSEKAKNESIIIVDQFNFSKNKTKEFAEAIKKLKINGSVLVGFNEKEIIFSRASRNIEKASNVPAGALNVKDLLDNKYLLLSKDSIKQIEERYIDKQ